MLTSVAVSAIAIVASIILFIILSYKGLSPILAALLAAVIVGFTCEGGVIPAIGLQITVVHNIVGGIGSNGHNNITGAYGGHGDGEHHFRRADVHLFTSTFYQRGNHYKRSNNTGDKLTKNACRHYIGSQYLCERAACCLQQYAGELIDHLRTT